MKSGGTSLAMAAMMALFMLSCFDPPEYSNIPEIEYESVSFFDVTDPSEVDSLVLVVRFKDGDGDLGIGGEGDTLFPLNSRFFYDTVHAITVPYYYPSEEFYMGDPLTRPQDQTFITYKTYRTDRYGWRPKLLHDTLPPFTKPYNCVNWEIRSVDGVVDTFYYDRNPYHYNIQVEFLVQNNGVFEIFDWTKEFAYPQCGITFDGRFPILSKDLSRSSALDGTIRYRMVSTGFTLLFSIKTLKLRVTIADRALNVSNTVETPPFTLQQIKK